MEEWRHVTAAALQYQYRIMRAYVRYHLHYTPDVLDSMDVRQLAEAFEDVQFVIKGKRR